MEFFYKSLNMADPEINSLIEEELERQQNQIELIASENIVSRAVLEAQGSILTNKYAEGYPYKRYYGGCEFVDEIENLAIERAKQLFNCNYANVQPHSGSQANQAAFMSLIKPGETILGMALNAGGHLTHGARPNQSGKWFNALQYNVNPQTGLIDYDEIAKLAKENQPKLIIAGASAYVRQIDFARIKEIAESVGAYFMADIAHYAGLIATGLYPSPFPHADIVTTTTHKTLRGPRGGMIMTNDEAIAKKVNSAVFPGLQGGPLMHVIAAKAVAFKEALQPEFTRYISNVIDNAKILAMTLKQGGYDLITDGTDCHMLVVDLRSKGLTGDVAERSLERAGLTCNKNSIPYDQQGPQITSGIRLGTAAGTTRGFTQEEFHKIGQFIIEILDGIAESGELANSEREDAILKEVRALCRAFPIYQKIAG